MKELENIYYHGQPALLTYKNNTKYARIERLLKPRANGMKEENWIWMVVIVPDRDNMPRFPIPITECRDLGYEITVYEPKRRTR